MRAAPPKAGEAEFSELLEVGCIAFGVCEMYARVCVVMGEGQREVGDAAWDFSS